MTHDYDIIIIGAGLVGTSLIAALQGQGLRIAVLEKNLPQAMTNQKPDNRPISLAYGSHVVLKTLGVWEALAPVACPINKVHVSEKGRFGTMKFTAEEMDVPALGYVVPFAKLSQSLYEAAAQTGVDFISVSDVSTIEASESGSSVIFATADGEKTLHCALLIAADGTRSRSRTLLNIATKETSSQEVAVTALIQLAHAHDNTAYERFSREGTLAILPLLDKHQCRLVWTMPESLQQEIAAWDDAKLCQYIEHYFKSRLGSMTALTRGGQFPLATVIAQEQIRPGFVLLGNAAHTLYPIAAQGFNLGLRDVAVLAEILVSAHRCKEALGRLEVLQDYQSWRDRDQKRTIGLTRGVSNIFGLQFPMLGFFRSVSMLAADVLTPLKKDLARQTMGLAGKLPKLVRGVRL